MIGDKREITALDNLIKKMSIRLTVSGGGYETMNVTCNKYRAFYLKSAYYIDNTGSRVPVDVTVSFGNAISISETETAIFTDGLGIKFDLPFSVVRISSLAIIAGNPIIYVDFYVANGDIIDNINYVSGNLNVSVVNFPQAASNNWMPSITERLIADKAVAKSYNRTLGLGVNSFELFTDSPTGSYINPGVSTTFSTLPGIATPNVIGKNINKIQVNFDVTVSGITNSYYDKELSQINAILNYSEVGDATVYNIPLELKTVFRGYVNSRNKLVGVYEYDFAPIKIKPVYEKINVVITPQSYAICESSKIVTMINVV